MSEEVSRKSDAPKSDPPHSKGRLFVERLNAYRNIILATAALATAIGSWLKPTDTTATRQSFDWTTKKVEELSKNDVQMHEDITALRAYLEGMKVSQAQTIAPAEVPSPVVGPRVSGSPTPKKRKPIRPSEGMSGLTMDKSMNIGPLFEQEIQEIQPELPDLKADPHQMKRPSFEDVATE